jgi:hypothetical protein
MATRTVSFHTLVCDGCSQQYGMDIQYASVIEARAAAYSEGWRFPEKVRMGGGESKSVSDVCPKCTDGWQRQAAPDPWKNRRKGGGSDG